MSITLTLPELSPELEERLAAMSEEERGVFAVNAMQARIAPVEVDKDDDLMMIGPPPSRGPIPVSQEEMATIIALSQAPAREPSERMKKALENHRRLSGQA